MHGKGHPGGRPRPQGAQRHPQPLPARKTAENPAYDPVGVGVSECEGCGAAVVQTGRGRPRKFCPECATPERGRERNREAGLRTDGKPRTIYPPRTCAASDCQESFTPARLGERYCSRRCWDRERDRNRSRPRKATNRKDGP